jgi:hypothetical protein
MLERFEHPNYEGVYAQTWGEALEFRLIKQSMSFQQNYFPVGSYNSPKITYPPG